MSGPRFIRLKGRHLQRAALGAALVFVLINAAVTGGAVNRLVQSHAEAARIAQVVRAGDRLSELISQAEAAHRGYVLNGLALDLYVYEQASEQVPSALAEFVKQSDGRSWEPRVASLRAEVRAWQASRHELAAEARSGGEDAVRVARDRAVTSARLQRMRAILDEAEEIEVAALELARASTVQIGARVKVLVTLQTGVALILLISVGTLADRERTRVANAARELERQVDEQTVLLRTRAEQLEGALLDRDAAMEELTELSEELERSNRELNDFAFIASHDLQEPLRKVRAFADLVVRRYAEALDEKGQDYLARMSNAAERMSVLIEDLLKLSRVARSPMVLAPVDVEGELRSVVQLFDVRAEELGATVQISGEFPTVDADVVQLRQLFQNLVGNALKFHRPGVPPVVSITGAPCEVDGEPGCRIEVADNGIGIDPKYHQRIFGAFQRLHGRSEYDGTGIGLAVVRRVVERHDGTIEVLSTPGEGTTMVVAFPLQGPERPPAEQVESS